jgi:hypothetical protein
MDGCGIGVRVGWMTGVSRVKVGGIALNVTIGVKRLVGSGVKVAVGEDVLVAEKNPGAGGGGAWAEDKNRARSKISKTKHTKMIKRSRNWAWRLALDCEESALI